MTKSYDKPPRDNAYLIDLLMERGLGGTRRDIEAIVDCVGYYRLTGYLHRFKHPNKEIFHAGLTIQDVWRLYSFDRALRASAMDAIGRIEVWFRTQLAQEATCASKDAFEYLRHWEANPKFKSACQSDLEHARETLHIKHFHETYKNPYPPTWMAVEVFSFGTTCQYYRVADTVVAGRLARRLGVDRLTVLNWFQILRATRNICAHHQRLWDVNINAQPNLKQLRHFSELPVAKTLLTFYTQHPELRFRIRDNVITRTPAYVPFCLCAHLIGVFRPQSAWQCRFLSLLKEYLPFLRTRIPELTTETFRMPGFCDEDFLSQPLWHPEE